MLPCGHTFCEKCIDRFSSAGSSCPVCRAAYQLPPIGARGFPPNTVVAALVDAARRIEVDSEVAPIEGPLCDLCIGPGRRLAALEHCAVCEHLLCAGHVAAHAKSKMSKDHIAESLTKFEDPVRPTKSLMCAEHVTEKLQAYCHDDDVLVCRECLLGIHMNHKVSTVPAVALEHTERVKAAVATAEGRSEALHGALAGVLAAEGQLRATGGRAEQELQRMFDEHIAAVRAREAELAVALQGMLNRKGKQLDAQREALELALCSAQTFIEQGVCVLATEVDTEIVAASTRIRRQAKMLDAWMWDLDPVTSGVVGVRADKLEANAVVAQFGSLWDDDVEAAECSVVCVWRTGERVAIISVDRIGGGKVPLVAVMSNADGSERRLLITRKADLDAEGGAEENAEVEEEVEGKETYFCKCDGVGLWQLAVTLRGEHVLGSPLAPPKLAWSLRSEGNCDFPGRHHG
jgi:hypothetical protein